MSEAVTLENREAKSETRTGGAFDIEKWIERWLGNAIHVFLSLLALLTFLAAVFTAWDTVMRDFPKLWQPVNEYSVLQEILQTILLIAIAAELGLLLLFHRTTAAVEVIIFVIARKMVSPDISVTGLLLGTAAIIALVITRFYYLPGKAK
ncbi:MAG TPA: hypothetical protein VNQ79_14730 [Blastocatellia bacterium]|nr:hypothetical protein [Blastocatellia bacterium]